MVGRNGLRGRVWRDLFLAPRWGHDFCVLIFYSRMADIGRVATISRGWDTVCGTKPSATATLSRMSIYIGFENSRVKSVIA